MSVPWIFVCPSSRGIGFALTRYLLASTPSTVPILATTRHREPSVTKEALLENLSQVSSGSGKEDKDGLAKRLSVVRCDVTDEASIMAAAQKAEELFPLDSHHLHFAAAIPGVLLNPEKSPSQIDAEAALRSFQINAVGPLLLAKHFFHFLPRKSTRFANPNPDDTTSGEEKEKEEGMVQLPRHATWLNMSARVGSTTDNRSGGWFSYRASKSAVNSLTRSLDVLLRTRAGENAVAVAYHPGTVRTDLSKDYWSSVPKDKLFMPEFAAERLVDVVSKLAVEERGKCWDWKGEEVPP
ncbi:C-signal-like protein [Cladobotryum mycophilum]|uniref:C-signal-like protein n=1 Tax=Cladobotryum mycophilum TaxID=491253 RepID=A0ABR0T378_9HYPO